jgi:TonB-linked SusC/RagA family outer membrane protein
MRINRIDSRGTLFALMLLCLLFRFDALNGQEKVNSVKGLVVNSNSEPLPGVSVIIRNTKTNFTSGTSTDSSGTFTFSRISPGSPYSFSFSTIGYEKQLLSGYNIKDNITLSLTVKLVSSVATLDQVVVVGYGTQKKESLTGSVVSIGANELQPSTDANAASRLQGRVAGVTITNGNSPGGEPTVRIRGYGSVNSNNPLYVIDGLPITGGLSQINPNDIETMTVLKDASASAIYGARGANGVILITTKRGKTGLSINFDSRVGVEQTTNQLDMANTQEYADINWLEYKNGGLLPGGPAWGNKQYGFGATPVIPDYINPTGGVNGSVDETKYSYPLPYNGITKANKVGTNWFDEIFNPALFQEYNLSIRGGSEKSKYAVSLGHTDQKGVVIYTGFKRYSIRFNSTFKLTDWLEAGQTLGAVHTSRVGFDNNSADNPVSLAYRMQPIVPVYDIKGNFAGTQSATTGDAENPVAELYRNKDDLNNNMRLLATTYLQANITKSLVFKTLVGIDYNNARSTNRDLTNPESIKARLTDNLTESYGGGSQTNWANTLNYSTEINDHAIRVLVGTEAVKNRFESFNGGRSQFAFTDLNYMILNAGETGQVSGGGFDEWRTFSYFGRLNYSYQNKYLLEGVVRRDASSRFHEKARWGTFPAFSAGWVLSKEAFMSDVTFISNLKLRGGWGKNGNDNVGNYNAYSTFRSSGSASYYNIVGNNSTQSQAGYYLYRLGNPDGRWEATQTTDIGLDVSMFKNRFEVNFDVFSRTTTDMLYPDSRPDTWGALLLPSVNIGEMKNKGFDLMLTYNSKQGRNFGYKINANISHYDNVVVRLNNNANEKRFGSDLRGQRYTLTQQGSPVSSFYGYVVEGIFNTKKEVDDHPKFNPSATGVDNYSKPGVFKYRDINGDGKITPLDRTIIGNPHPDFSYGFNIDLNYKSWDMSMFFQGVQGNDVINYVRRWIDFQQFQNGRSKRRLYESWTEERFNSGGKITMPMALADDSQLQTPSSYFVEDGSYLRMKNVQIGYSLPSHLASKWKMKNLRIYVQSKNLFTVTKYSGLDPENRSDNDIDLGVDQGTYPSTRSFMVGINLGL